MEQIVAILFLDRTLTHMEHLRTSSYAQHKALQEFYDGVIDLADTLAETYQGYEGIMKIPLLSTAPSGKIEDHLAKRVLEIQKLRKSCDLSAIQNIVDEIVGLYLSTVYKLRQLS
jgi:hypothetical protein